MADANSGLNALTVTFSGTPVENWKTQIKQTTPLTANHLHEFSFAAKAASNRQVYVHIENGFLQQPVNITNSWDTYTYQFTPGSSTDAPVVIYLGDSNEQVWLDDIKLHDLDSQSSNVVGPLVYVSKNIESDEDSDSQAEAGETVTVRVTVENQGTADAVSVSGTMSTSNPAVTITDDSGSWGNIAASSQKNSTDYFSFTVDPSLSQDILVTFDLTLTDGNNNWNDSFTLTVKTASPSGSEVDLLSNGGFETGVIDPWIFLDLDNVANEIVVTDEVRSGTYALSVLHNSLPSANWRTQLKQNINVIGGHLHRFDFSTKAASSRNLTIQVESNDVPENDYLYESLTIGSAWLDTSFTFTPSSDDDIRVVVYLGDATPQIWLDDLKLIDVDSSGTGGGPPPSNNLLSNGDFETGEYQPEWTLQDNQSVATASATTSGAYEGSYSFTVSMSSAPANFWECQLRQSYDFVQDHTYKLTLQAKAASSRNIIVEVPDFLWDSSNSLTTSWQEYTFQFTPSSSATKPVTFHFGESPEQIWLDGTVLEDLTLAKVSVPQEPEIKLPEAFVLHQNYPNPFNPRTTIRYDIPRTINVSLIIYNTIGKKVKTLVNESQSAGVKSVVWDSRDDNGIAVASGIYVYKVVAGDFTQTKKLLLLK